MRCNSERQWPGFSILNDPTSLQALYEIDRERKLLCIGEASEKTLRSINVYRILTHSQRRTGSVDAILAHLDKLRPPDEE